ncbi:MAG TPA: hypothetical protein DEQ32_14205 [Gammaproteobacteria bacterium]|nr:hypothetical protein [Gammaproteobacteria bacterium]
MGKEVGRVVPATSQALSVVGQFDRVNTNHMDKIATSIRGIAGAINSVDTTKSLNFRANVSTLASTEMSQVVTAAVRLKRDDVSVVTDLVEQANKLAAASTVSRGDEMSALVQSVAQIARIQGGGGGAGGAAQSTPIVVENTLKLDGHTLDRHIQRVSRKEIDRQSRS